MVIDKFNMVDMEGIDLIESQGIEIPGLYQKLVESITRCRYTVLYNWQFNKIVIPPTPVELVVENEEVKINEEIAVTSGDIVVINSLTPPVPEPVIDEITITENGQYIAPSGVDGYNPVIVSVPSEEPSLQSLAVTENGNYLPDTGYDGFSDVSVNVPQSQSQPKFYWDLTSSVVDELQGISLTLVNSAAITADGASIPNISSQIKLPTKLKPFNIKVDIDIGDTEAVLGSNHLRLFVSDLSDWNAGLIYRSSGEWSFYSGSQWDSGSGITDINFFSNSLLSIEIDYNNRWKIYKDGVLVYSPAISLTSNNYPLAIGAASQSYFPAIIKSIKIY